MAHYEVRMNRQNKSEREQHAYDLSETSMQEMPQRNTGAALAGNNQTSSRLRTRSSKHRSRKERGMTYGVGGEGHESQKADFPEAKLGVEAC